MSVSAVFESALGTRGELNIGGSIPLRLFQFATVWVMCDYSGNSVRSISSRPCKCKIKWMKGEMRSYVSTLLHSLEDSWNIGSRSCWLASYPIFSHGPSQGCWWYDVKGARTLSSGGRLFEPWLPEAQKNWIFIILSLTSWQIWMHCIMVTNSPAAVIRLDIRVEVRPWITRLGESERDYCNLARHWACLFEYVLGWMREGEAGRQAGRWQEEEENRAGNE